MNLADVIVSRSGAMTITEISITGKPAIFIPFPFATENHQEYNAKVLESIGAAKILLNKDLETTDLNKYVEDIIYNKELVINKFDDRKKMEIFFDIMILFYKDILDYKINNKNNIFNIDDIEKISKKNSIDQVQNKINYIIEAKKNLKVNANINLTLDKLVIELEGDNNG